MSTKKKAPPVAPADGEDDDGILAIGGSAKSPRQTVASQGASKRQRNARLLSESAAFAQGAEVIDIENQSFNVADQSPQEAHMATYRQTLGPMRMEFVSNGGGKLKYHAFDNIQVAPCVKPKLPQLHNEYLEYLLNLPVTPQASIFVRVGESRLDLVRALITGPEGTPYGHGCFFFDFYLHDYPTSAPQAKFLTTGGGTVRFNPNLYNCGKVCLSLLGTWSGPGWEPNKSTLLQVLVSIQGLIMVEDPWYNEPSYETRRGTPSATQLSDAYNANIRHQTLQWAIADPLRKVLDELDGEKNRKKSDKKKEFEYAEFSAVVAQHFVHNANVLETQLNEWTKQDASMKPQAKVIRELMARLLKTQDVATMPAEKAQRKKAARLPVRRSSKQPIRRSSRLSSSARNVRSKK